MNLVFNILVFISVIIVLFVLTIGLYTLTKHKQGLIDAKRSNKLMRLRVMLQFIAVILIIIALFFKKQTG